MRQQWIWLAVLFFVSGCATFRGAGPASRDKWYVITTTHFVVYTDVDEKTAGRAATELETTRDALIAAVWPGATFADMARTRVFVLATPQEFQGVFGPNVPGLFAPGAQAAFYLHAPTENWSASAGPSSKSPSVLRHALAHQLIAAAFPRAPPWLDEGLAQFLETAHVAPDGRSVVLGSTNAKARARFVDNPNVTLRRLLEWKEPIGSLPDREGLGLYGTSYMFVHWLFLHRGEAFAGYLRTLAGPIDPQKAWEDAFPGFDPDATASILADDARNERTLVNRPVATSAPFLDIRQLAPPDVHVAWAQVMFGAAPFAGNAARGFETKARWEVKQALVLSPAHVEALTLDDGSLTEERLRWAHQAAALHPEDARAFALLGAISTNAKDRERAYRHSLELNPNEPHSLKAFAVFLLGRGRALEALPFVERAVRLAPYDFDAIDTYADVLVQLDRCGAAVAQGLRAAHLAREADDASIRRMSKHWGDRKAACKGHQETEPGAEGSIVAAVQANDAGGHTKNSDADHTATSARLDSSLAAGSQDRALPPSQQREEEAVRDQGAAVEDSPPGARSGLTASAGIGFGYVFGSFEGTGGFNGSLDGSAFDVGASVGWWLIPEFGVSVEAGFFRHSFSDQPIKNVNFGSTNGLGLARFGFLADVYMSASSPLHLAFGFDFVRGAWNGDEGIYGTPLPAYDELTGYFQHISVGMAWRAFGASLGPSLRFCHGTAEGDYTSASFSGLSLVGNAVF